MVFQDSDAIVHISIVDIVADFLKRSILNQEFLSDELISESQLSTQLGVSRTTIRKALRSLEAEGLLKHVPHKGMVVLNNANDGKNYCFEAINILTMASAELTQGELSPACKKRIVQLHEKLCELWEETDIPQEDFLAAEAKLDRAFHTEIIEAGRNPVIKACNDMMQDKWPGAMSAVDVSLHRQSHEKVLDALELVADPNTKADDK